MARDKHAFKCRDCLADAIDGEVTKNCDELLVVDGYFFESGDDACVSEAHFYWIGDGAYSLCFERIGSSVPELGARQNSVERHR